MKKIFVMCLVFMLVIPAMALARTTIQTNGFYMEGVGYVTTQTLAERDAMGHEFKYVVGFNDKGQVLFQYGNGGPGWGHGFMQGGFAGMMQGAGVATAGALLRPSNTNVDNSSGSTADGGDAFQSTKVNNTNINWNNNFNKTTKGGWIPPGQNK